MPGTMQVQMRALLAVQHILRPAVHALQFEAAHALRDSALDFDLGFHWVDQIQNINRAVGLLLSE